MNKCILLCLISLLPAAWSQDQVPPFRPPAIPLVAVDPYFSVWSPSEKLNDAFTVHWTGREHRLASVIHIDGVPYRLMGDEPRDIQALPQTGLNIQPCLVTYAFAGAGVSVILEFMTPLLPEDLMILSRPVTYLTWQVTSTDGKEHDVSIYYDNRAELTVNDANTETVKCSLERFGPIQALKAGSTAQPVLGRKGDDVRINWGYQYVAVADDQQGMPALYNKHGEIAEEKDLEQGPASNKLAVTFALGKVGATPISRWLVLAYDDLYSVQFFGDNLKGYWKKDGMDIGGLLSVSAAEYGELRGRCAAFDTELMADLEKAGGPKYALLGALAYRQSLAASKVVADANGQPLFFCKENTSNGCMGTVDVFYPQAPLPLLISPSLSKAMLIPVLEYASSPLWQWPNAPHDVGTWPIGNGQVYGGSDSDGGMPVEETGNMLLLVAAVAQVEGNADFSAQYWPLLTTWAEYLKSKGFDPENQLCTDDFAGHLAHNANLSVKSICALGAYGKLAVMRDDEATGQAYLDLAKGYALEWMKVADDGDHFRLAFDQPGTWSSKYNLVWDRLLDMNLFPEAVARKEMDFYLKNLDLYGLPLDGRKHEAPGKRQAWWSKTDWAVWTACLTENRDDFDAITAPIYRFFNEAERRVGLTDLYFTDQPDTARMHSRPVIGGVFIKMLYDGEVWKKWAARDKTKANGPWAPLPEMPLVKKVVSPDSIRWNYTLETPGEGWFQPGFDDRHWKQGTGGFGARGTPGIKIRRKWDTSDIWLRGEITIPPGDYENLHAYLFHDEDTEIYVNGVEAAVVSGYSTEYVPVPISPGVELGPGTFLFAVHCRQSSGGQGIDLGIADIIRVSK